jgi:phage tail P2-like protein
MIKFDDGELKNILPDQFTRQPQIRAISYALKQEYDRYRLCLAKAYVYASIDTCDHDVLDYLAADMHVRYYRTDFDIEKKRTLIKSAIDTMSRDGTKYATDIVIQTVFGDGQTVEWFDYGGEPGHFRIELDNDSGYDVSELLAIIQSVKRESAHLDEVSIKTHIEQQIYFGHFTSTDVGITGESDDPEILEAAVLDTMEFGSARIL